MTIRYRINILCITRVTVPRSSNHYIRPPVANDASGKHLHVIQPPKHPCQPLHDSRGSHLRRPHHFRSSPRAFRKRKLRAFEQKEAAQHLPISFLVGHFALSLQSHIHRPCPSFRSGVVLLLS
ncbi:hypothetical protein VTI28DRAFT_6873 [Corynascus sepedonium]